MPYEILKHTADLRMRVWADTLERLFEDAAEGLMMLIKPSAISNHQQPTSKREISIEAADKTALLVDFLNEVLSLAQINKEIYTSIRFKNFLEITLEAELDGTPVDEFNEDIKAVTYHEADVKQNEKGEWETMLVFDV